MEDLIIHSAALFQPSNLSPPLPPAPLGEAPPIVQYGSAHTKVAQVPLPLPGPRSSSPRHHDPYVIRTTQSEGRHTELQRHRKNPSDDFAPQMPSYPANSIHPSLRSGPMSASPARQSMPPPSRTAQYYEEQIPYAQYTNPPHSATLPLPPGAAPPSPQKRDLNLHPSSPLVSPWSDGFNTTPTTATSSLSQPLSPTTSTGEGTLVQSEEFVKRSASNGATASPASVKSSFSTTSSRLQAAVTTPTPSSTSSTETAVPDPEVVPPTPPKGSPPRAPSPAATTSDAGTVDSYYADPQRRSNNSSGAE